MSYSKTDTNLSVYSTDIRHDSLSLSVSHTILSRMMLLDEYSFLFDGRCIFGKEKEEVCLSGLIISCDTAIDLKGYMCLSRLAASIVLVFLQNTLFSLAKE